MKGVKLETINDALRCVGLVLVVARPTPPDDESTEPTRFWIETWRGYELRTRPKDGAP